MRKKSRKPGQPPEKQSSPVIEPVPKIKPQFPHGIVALALLVLVVVVWSNSFRGAFVLDSRFLVLQDPRVHQFNATNLDLIFNRPYLWSPVNSGLYRPFTTLTFLFNYAVLG